MAQKPKRILLKLSGEVLVSDDKSVIFDEKRILAYAEAISQLRNKGIELTVVIGGGNIFRGRDNQLSFMKEKETDWVGLSATILNGIVLKYALENSYQQKAKIVSFYDYQTIIEKYNKIKINQFLQKGGIVISVAMGVPGFSTDTIAANLARDLSCEMILKGTKVDGVYSADPITNAEAVKYGQLSYQEAIDQNLQVMDQEAFKICQKNKITIRVFNIYQHGNILKAAMGEEVGTIIS